MRPIAEIMFNDFAGVCMDPIFNHAAKQRFMSGAATHVPMVIRMMVGGGIGGFGAQHSQSLEAWFAHVPGLQVVMPSPPYAAKGDRKSVEWGKSVAVRDDSGGRRSITKNTETGEE